MNGSLNTENLFEKVNCENLNDMRARQVEESESHEVCAPRLQILVRRMNEEKGNLRRELGPCF